MRLRSNRDRPFHLGAYGLEDLPRADAPPPLDTLPPMQPVDGDAAPPGSLVHPIARYQAMFDLVRDGAVQALPAEVSDDPAERSRHLKAAGLYFDASMMGIARIAPDAWLAEPLRNPQVRALGEELERSQPRSFAAGMDMILADVLDAARLQHGPVPHHTHTLVVLVAHPRPLRAGEPGTDWLHGAEDARAAVLASQTAVLLASYLRLLGHEARAHSATCSDLHLGRLAVAAGLALPRADAGGVALVNPFVGTRFGLAAVSTTFEMAPDRPLAGTALRAAARAPADPYARRGFHQGPHPVESLPHRDEPTTLIDHARVPRFPKRADFFARALFGDLGRDVQDQARNAHYVMKSPIGACARRALGALLLLQFGDARGPVHPGPADPQGNAQRLKAASYWLGADAVGACRVPEWAWYSHDAGGNPMPAYHPHALNLLVDQGFETMEGASGDDWISVAQSMRAYLRFSLIGGIVAEQIRRLGWSARVHSVLDGDVLQPPLLLLSGLGEVSRIGEVILHPYLGPRLKSGTVTTDMPMAFDRPIDFGLQRFCEGCSKCARECPSGAITAGPKVVYNGYEIWKSDAEKCARYRITNAGGGMCGRCMKTCPWNLEGLLAEHAVRRLAMHAPGLAPWIAALDDRLDRGTINPVKTWWWDIELDRRTGRYVQAAQTHRRGLQKSLRLRAEDQTLAVYPADRMPPPFPVAFPVDREAGIARYRALLSPVQYRQRLAEGRTEGLAPPFVMPSGPPPVLPVQLVRRDEMTPEAARYELRALDGAELPAFTAGAHVDVVIAPEYLRAFSLAGDPADRGRWLLGVQREVQGRGGSALMHRAFRPGRRLFVSPPRNHFPLHEEAAHSVLIAGGIGVTPLLAMAHRLHALGGSFELHVCARDRAHTPFLDDLQQAAWHANVTLHLSAEGSRADLSALIPRHRPGHHLYTCGGVRLMDAVFEAAASRGWPDDALHREYFALPEAPPREDHPFTVVLARSGRRVSVDAGVRATDAMAAAGVGIETKCSDGLCGVCARRYDAARSGEVEHRDVVLSAAERRGKVILCCVRMRRAGDELVLDA